jgi:ribonucleoside-diphosphate reductase beta chain
LTVKVCCESYQLSRKEVYEAHKNIPAVKAIDDFLMNATKGCKNLKMDTLEGKQKFVKLLFTFYLICEGTMFYSTFAAILSLFRRNLLPGLGEQIKYTLRDEAIHVKFGTYVINTLKTEYPEVFTESLNQSLIKTMKQAVELEQKYAEEILPHGILGITSDMFHQYSEYMANRRLEGIGMKPLYEAAINPFPWMSEVVDLSAQVNFFEGTVEEYQQAGNLDWDDF